MKKKKKIVIIGNSVALRVRPPAKGIIKNYGLVLEENLNKTECLWEVVNMGFGRAITQEVVYKIDEYVRSFPDIFIVNLGAVDAPNREISLWYSNVLYGRRSSKLKSLWLFLYYKIIIRIRRLAVKLRFYRSWVKLNDFEKNIQTIITAIKKDTNAKIIILGINKGNERMEHILPGTKEKYSIYSKKLKEISSKNDIAFVDVSDLESATHFPDGVHYNEEGHKEIAKRLSLILSGEYSND